MTDLHDTAEALAALLPANMDDYLRRNPTRAEVIAEMESKLRGGEREEAINDR